MGWIRVEGERVCVDSVISVGMRGACWGRG